MGARTEPDELLSGFGQRVRRRRERLGWTQEYLAEVTGLHWTYIGQIERGRRNLTLINIVRLAKGLGIKPGKLMDGLEPTD
jgi:transcriptional regulator with XRE-family HTH domain